MGRRLLLWGVLLVAMALLAFWLQSALEQVCLVPAIDLLRRNRLFLQAIPQWVYWSLLVVGVALIAVGSLTTAGRLRRWRPTKQHQATVPGPVGKLAQHIHNTRRGPYFKWLVAHRLAELAQAILIQRNTLRAEHNAQGDRLKGGGWDAQYPAHIRAYLEAGLDRAPMARPRRRLRSRGSPTSLDLDPSRVVEYLSPEVDPHESQTETKA